MTDPIIESVCDKLRSRSETGVKKYGTTLADAGLTDKQLLIHLQEELMDAVNYIESVLRK